MVALTFLALVTLIFIGIPILLALGLTGLVGITLAPDLIPSEFPKRMFTFIDSFSLLALPYFILAGEIMSSGGMSRKLVDFAEKMVGHLRAGLAQAAVVACVIFANVSGSATASTAAIGSILIPSMKERNYKPGFVAALLGTSGIIGSIIPPSMIMIVYGSMAGVSIGGLFFAGFLPGLIISLMLMGTIWLHSFKAGFPELRETTGSFSWSGVIKSAGSLWTALLAPIVVLGGILAGFFTATEAGVIACFYAFFVSFFVYRSLRISDLPAILIRAAITTTIVVGIISVAGAFGFLLTNIHFEDSVKSLLEALPDNEYLVLAVLIIIMSVLSMFVESLAVLIILIPVISKIGKLYGFDPFYFGMLMIMATQIGATTPPVAVCLFVATSITGTTYDQTLKYCLPFVVALFLALLVVFLFPPLSTFIPHLFLK